MLITVEEGEAYEFTRGERSKFDVPFYYSCEKLPSRDLSSKSVGKVLCLRALRKPSLFVEESERVISKNIFEAKNGKGVDIMNKDWDNLFILDACRYDIFPEHSEIEGEYRTVVSRGNDSRSFIHKNFSNRELYDTIYVTANPFVENISDDFFFRVVYKDLFKQWDESLSTIPPNAVVKKVLDVNEKHPDKRIIAHFMQPHAPYIGEKG